MASTIIGGVKVKFRPPAKISYCPKPASACTTEVWKSFPRFAEAVRRVNKDLGKLGFELDYGTDDSGKTIRLIVKAYGKLHFIGEIVVSKLEHSFRPVAAGSIQELAIQLLQKTPRKAKLPYTRIEMLVYAIGIDKKGWKLEANPSDGKTRRYSDRSIVQPLKVGDAIAPNTGETTVQGGLQTYHTAIDKLHRSGAKSKNDNGNNPNRGGKKGRGISKIRTTEPSVFIIDTIDRRNQTGGGTAGFLRNTGVNG